MSRDNLRSSFEKTFTTYETFRRNKHYYDALKISEVEHLKEKQRRKPKVFDSDKEHMIDNAFHSAKKER